MRLANRRGAPWLAVSVAMLLIAVPAIAAGGYKPGRYGGTILNPASTIPSRITFTVTTTHVLQLMTTDVTAVCNNLRPGNLRATGGGGFATIAVQLGSFAVSNVGDSSDFRVSGRIKRGRAIGTLRFTARFAADGVTFDPAGPVVCDSGVLKWMATKQ